MADQPAQGPIDPAAAAMARSQANMFTKTPDVPTRTPSADEMRQADQTAGQRGQTTAERALQYRQQYDRAPEKTPTEAKPENVIYDEQSPKQPSEQPVDRDQLERDISAFRKWQADAKVRAELLPSPESYRIVLPESFKAPEGIEFKFRDNDPALEQARQWAHKRGLDQETFSEGLALYAGQQVRDMVAFKAARDAEVQKLGSAAPARIDAILNWLHGTVGRESANAIASMMVTSDIVAGFEKLATKFANGGVISGPGGGARNPVPRGPTDEQWSQMGFGERISYARSASAPPKPRR